MKMNAPKIWAAGHQPADFAAIRNAAFDLQQQGYTHVTWEITPSSSVMVLLARLQWMTAAQFYGIVLPN